MRYKGVVKWFNNTKGYGFILSDDFSEELFVHYSYVDMEGYKTLKADQAVTFETQQTPTGFHAKAVTVIGSDVDADPAGQDAEPGQESLEISSNQVQTESDEQASLNSTISEQEQGDARVV